MITLEEFELHVQKSDNGCWLWTGKRKSKGYGCFSQNGHWVYAHRTAYELYVGEIPKGLFVCHKCDNPPCVRPDHLFVGTNSDNIRDCCNKNRNAAKVHPECFAKGDKNGMRLHPEKILRGEQNPNAKLSSEEVQKIRNCHNSGMSYNQLVKMFHASKSNICRIVRGEAWKHLL